MKISQIIYRIWLAALAILVIVCSLERSPVMIGGTVRTTCFAMLGMLVLLGMWLLIPETSIEDAELKNVFAVKNSPKGEAAAALRQAAAFILAAVLYWCYCFRMDGLFSTNSKMDALVAGGLICAAVLLGGSGLGQRDLHGQGL